MKQNNQYHKIRQEKMKELWDSKEDEFNNWAVEIIKKGRQKIEV